MIKLISALIDYLVLIVSVTMLLLGIYAFWDSHQVYELASADTYRQYRPETGNELSYEQLKEINSDVIGWINVYGTKIDYPLLQGESNDTYINTTVEKKFSTAGSIFLDYRNNADFSDFNSIIYGHHMEKRLMFGDIDKFTAKKFFKKHKYGKLYVERARHGGRRRKGITFFAILKTHGSDSTIFAPAMADVAKRQSLVDYIYGNAIQSRRIDISHDDHIILLDTCTFTITNGRYILAGRLDDKVHPDPFPAEDGNKYASLIEKVKRIPAYLWILLLILLLYIAYRIYERSRRKKANEES